MTKLIGLVASETHYLDHLQPIWDLLPDSVKGDRRKDVILVGGYADVKDNPLKPYVYVEHGAGQSYVEPTDPHTFRSTAPYYSGGRAHQHAALFICPNDEVAARWHERYPDKPTAVVGCPKLDPWHSGARGAVEDRTVAITFHWDALFTGVPETVSAFGQYYQATIEAATKWRNEGWTVLGHNHPRYPAVREFWVSPVSKAAGIEYVSADEVLDRASVLVADNTSMQAEFLSLGRRVVWLNEERYRRDVNHGGRFWDWPQMGGLQIDSAEDLAALNLDDVPSTTGHPYAFADGLAASRAAQSIESLLS